VQKIFNTIFEFFGQFYFQIDVFKLDEIFPELGIRGISYFTDWRQTRGAKKVAKTVLKTRLKTKETMCTLVFSKKTLSLFGTTLKFFFFSFSWSRKYVATAAKI
jgi:nicotinamide riboside transporter PnuC